MRSLFSTSVAAVPFIAALLSMAGPAGALAGYPAGVCDQLRVIRDGPLYQRLEEELLTAARGMQIPAGALARLEAERSRLEGLRRNAEDAHDQLALLTPLTIVLHVLKNYPPLSPGISLGDCMAKVLDSEILADAQKGSGAKRCFATMATEFLTHRGNPKKVLTLVTSLESEVQDVITLVRSDAKIDRIRAGIRERLDALLPRLGQYAALTEARRDFEAGNALREHIDAECGQTGGCTIADDYVTIVEELRGTRCRYTPGLPRESVELRLRNDAGQDLAVEVCFEKQKDGETWWSCSLNPVLAPGKSWEPYACWQTGRRRIRARLARDREGKKRCFPKLSGEPVELPDHLVARHCSPRSPDPCWEPR
jgi:hypothetical protein